jgi:hypothetical protein
VTPAEQGIILPSVRVLKFESSLSWCGSEAEDLMLCCGLVARGHVTHLKVSQWAL